MVFEATILGALRFWEFQSGFAAEKWNMSVEEGDSMGKKRVAVRKVTADKGAELGRLANLLYEFLPLSSHSESATTFRTIFSESFVGHYLDGETNKRKALEKGWRNVYRYHKRLPQKLIRKIIPAAIDYRMYKRKPLTQGEVDELSDILFNLGIDMRKELAAIEIDDMLPRIKVPPRELQERLRNHDLDPYVASEPLELFCNGHFNEAVRKGMEMFETEVRNQSQSNKFGRDLMATVLGDGSLITTETIKAENQAGFVEGYKFLTMGSMAAIRNIFSHGNEENRSPEECFEMLLFINWLFRYLKTDRWGPP